MTFTKKITAFSLFISLSFSLMSQEITSFQDGGGEVGNGGSYSQSEEATQLYQLQSISNEITTFFCESPLAAHEFQAQLIHHICSLKEKVLFKMSEQNLYDVEGVERDALNFPKSQTIVFSRKAVFSSTDRSQIKSFVLMFHELLGLAGYAKEDSSYKISSKIAKYLNYKNYYSLVIQGKKEIVLYQSQYKARSKPGFFQKVHSSPTCLITHTFMAFAYLPQQILDQEDLKKIEKAFVENGYRFTQHAYNQLKKPHLKITPYYSPNYNENFGLELRAEISARYYGSGAGPLDLFHRFEINYFSPDLKVYTIQYTEKELTSFKRFPSDEMAERERLNFISLNKNKILKEILDDIPYCQEIPYYEMHPPLN
jgi:hypothetical protein